MKQIRLKHKLKPALKGVKWKAVQKLLEELLINALGMAEGNDASLKTVLNPLLGPQIYASNMEVGDVV